MHMHIVANGATDYVFSTNIVDAPEFRLFQILCIRIARSSLF